MIAIKPPSTPPMAAPITPPSSLDELCEEALIGIDVGRFVREGGVTLGDLVGLLTGVGGVGLGGCTGAVLGESVGAGTLLVGLKEGSSVGLLLTKAESEQIKESVNKCSSTSLASALVVQMVVK